MLLARIIMLKLKRRKVYYYRVVLFLSRRVILLFTKAETVKRVPA